MADEQIRIVTNVDRGSLSAAEQALSGFESRRAQAAQRVVQASAATADRQIADIRRVEREEEAATQRSLRRGLSRSQTLNDTNQGGRRGQGWDFLGGQSFRTIGFQLRAIPGGGLPETIGRLSPLADVITEIATGASTAGAAALGLTGGLVFLGVTFGETLKSITAVTEAYQKQLQTMDEFARKATDMTNQQIRERLRAIEESLPRENQLAEEYRAADDAAKAAIRERAGTFPGIFGIVPGGDLNRLIGEGEALENQYRTQADRVSKLAIEQLELNEALLEATNVYAEARTEIERLLNIQGMTAAERDAEIASNEQRMNALSQISLNQTLSPEETQVALELFDQLILRNTELRAVGTTVADLTDQENLLYEARKRGFNEQADLVMKIQDMTQAERNERMREIENEIAMWQRLGEQRAGDPAVADAVAEATQRLNNELSTLRTVIWTTADAVDAAATRNDLLNEQTDMLFETQTALGEALEAVRVATEAYDKALAEHGERLAEIEEDFRLKRIDAVRDANRKQEKVNEKRDKNIEEAAEDHAKRIAEIHKKYDRALEDAIASRDAMAAYQAAKRRKEELEDEEERNKEKLEDIEEAYQEETDAIGEALDDRFEDLQRALEQAKQAERKRYADQARDLQAAIDKQKAMVWNAENQLQAIRTGFQDTRVISEVNWYSTLDNVANSYQQAILFRWQYFWGAMLGGMPASPAQGGTPDHGTPWAGWAGQGGYGALDRRIDQRIGMTLTGGGR